MYANAILINQKKIIQLQGMIVCVIWKYVKNIKNQ